MTDLAKIEDFVPFVDDILRAELDWLSATNDLGFTFYPVADNRIVCKVRHNLTTTAYEIQVRVIGSAVLPAS